MQDRVIIILGSASDEEFTKPMCSTLQKLGVEYDLRVSSAHKTPDKLLEMVKEYESSEDRIVYITVAGKSNALSGLVDANTRYPVIACPPLDVTFGSMDIYSSLRTPRGVTPVVILDPENAALIAAKILALSNLKIREKVQRYQQQFKEKIELEDLTMRKMKSRIGDTGAFT